MKKFLLVIYVALLVSACKGKKTTAAPPPTPGTSNAPALSVEGLIIKPSAISETVEVTGNILPFESTEIRPEISGRVVQLNIREGTIVSKGSLLVKIFDEDLQAQLKKLKVQLQIA